MTPHCEIMLYKIYFAKLAVRNVADRIAVRVLVLHI